MDPIVVAAGTALVSAMAADTWEQARRLTVEWWRKVYPRDADEVDLELEAAHTQVLAARADGDDEIEHALVGTWRLRLQRLLDENPTLRPELQRLLNERLASALPETERNRIQQIIDANAYDHARQFIAAHDQHISGI